VAPGCVSCRSFRGRSGSCARRRRAGQAFLRRGVPSRGSSQYGLTSRQPQHCDPVGPGCMLARTVRSSGRKNAWRAWRRKRLARLRAERGPGWAMHCRKNESAKERRRVVRASAVRRACRYGRSVSRTGLTLPAICTVQRSTPHPVCPGAASSRRASLRGRWGRTALVLLCRQDRGRLRDPCRKTKSPEILSGHPGCSPDLSICRCRVILLRPGGEDPG